MGERYCRLVGKILPKGIRCFGKSSVDVGWQQCFLFSKGMSESSLLENFFVASE